MKTLIDTFISKCKSWDEFVSKTNSLSDNIYKGILFERLTQIYLLNTSTYSSKLINVWWCNNKGELPSNIQKKLNLPKEDEGIDLICETVDGDFWSVQSKYKANQDKAPTRKELSTFEALSFNTCKNISLAIVVHTSNKPVKKSSLMPNVTEIGLDKWLEISEEEWKRLRQYCKSNKLVPPKKRMPRKHQKLAINDAVKHFSKYNNSRGKLIMPCGTGKSLTAFWIAQALGAKNIIVSVPSLALIRQGLADWTAEYLSNGIKPDWIAICADDTVGNTSDADSTVASVYDTGIPTTTNEKIIENFLRKKSKFPKIIFTTYQSGQKLCEAAKTTKITFDLLISDEAHKTVGVSNLFSILLFDKNIRVKRRVFMTATERVLKTNRNIKEIIVSMDNLDDYGEVFHQLSFKEAIRQKIICDYKIITLAVTKKDAISLINENSLLSISIGKDKIETDSHNLSVGIALKKIFEKHEIKHAVTFHSNIQRSKFFKSQQEEFLKNTGIVNYHISSKHSAGQRADILRSFSNDNKSIISNAKCLTEGVDIPSIDCVVFADPKQSVVDIVQAAGRAMRQSKKTGKKFGYILLPLIVPDEEDLSDFSEKTNFKYISRIITSLSTQDERIIDELRNLNRRKSNIPSNIIQIQTSLFNHANINSSDLVNAINTRVWRSVGKANWKTFEDALQWSHLKNFKGQNQWFKHMSSEKRPADIPYSPNIVYKDKWVSWGHWLGTNNVATKNRIFLSFNEAKKITQKLGLQNTQDWRNYCLGNFKNKITLPKNIPANPQRTYKKDWQGWGVFLGTNRVATHLRSCRNFTDAKQFVNTLGLKSEKGGRKPKTTDLNWRNYIKGNLKDVVGLKPEDIPHNPTKVYSEWTSWPDWLGTQNYSKSVRMLEYDEARKYVLSLKLNEKQIIRKDNGRKNDARNKWNDYCLGLYGNLPDKPQNIPTSIHHYYKDIGYKGYRHFITPDSLL